MRDKIYYRNITVENSLSFFSKSQLYTSQQKTVKKNNMNAALGILFNKIVLLHYNIFPYNKLLMQVSSEMLFDFKNSDIHFHQTSTKLETPGICMDKKYLGQTSKLARTEAIQHQNQLCISEESVSHGYLSPLRCRNYCICFVTRAKAR